MGKKMWLLRTWTGYVQGKVNGRLISLLDITATTLRMAGIEPPLNMRSRDLLHSTGPKKNALP
jgi:arylsulfatase A-like enzyme